MNFRRVEDIFMGVSRIKEKIVRKILTQQKKGIWGAIVDETIPWFLEQSEMRSLED